jgi:hypothetical protein
MFIRDPGSQIPFPKTATEERDEKKKLLSFLFLFSPKFHKIEHYYSFEKLKKKKIGSIFKELSNFLPKKWSLSSQTYGFGIRDPRSMIRDTEKTYSESARLPEDVCGLGARHQPAGLGDTRGRLQLVARQHPRPDTRISKI